MPFTSLSPLGDHEPQGQGPSIADRGPHACQGQLLSTMDHRFRENREGRTQVCLEGAGRRGQIRTAKRGEVGRREMEDESSRGQRDNPRERRHLKLFPRESFEEHATKDS